MADAEKNRGWFKKGRAKIGGSFPVRWCSRRDMVFMPEGLPAWRSSMGPANGSSLGCSSASHRLGARPGSVPTICGSPPLFGHEVRIR